MNKRSVMRRLPLLVAASAMGLALAISPANAQGHEDQSLSALNETVRVTAPRHAPRFSSLTDTPIEDVAISRTVPYSGLDLATHHGAHVLRDRIDATARQLCLQLSALYPLGQPGQQSCYRHTRHEAMYSANHAIREARYENG